MKLGIIASSGMLLPETQAWVKAIADAGGAVNGDQIFHTNRFVEKLKINNLWNDLIAYYPMLGAFVSSPISRLAHTINLRTPGTYNLTYIGTAAPNYHSGTWSMRNVSDMANTGIVPSTVFDINNLSWGFYSFANTGGTPFGVRGTDISGTYTTSTRAFSSYITTTSPYLHSVANAWSTSGGFVDSVREGANSASAIYSTRNSSTSLKIFHRGVLKAISTTANPGTLPDKEIYVGGINNNGTAILTGSATLSSGSVMTTCSIWFATRSFSDAEMTTFYNIEQEFMTNTGRGA